MAARSYDDIADLYDVVVPFDLDLAFYVDFARGASGPVLELTAGTGRVTLPLVRAGAEVVCVDGSSAMLNVLRAKLAADDRAAELVVADVRSFDLGRRFPLVLFPFHAFHEIVDEGDRARTLAAIRRHVAPGGRFVCALHNPTVRATTLDGAEGGVGGGVDAAGRRIELRGRFLLDPATGVVTGEQTYFVDGVPRAPIPVRFALFPPAAFEAAARAAGFEIEARFGDYERSEFESSSSPHAIYVLR